MSKRSFYSLLSVAVVGALLAILIFPLSLFAHEDADPDAHPADDHVHYDENGMGMVRDFDSTDPEGARIEWNVRGVDAADFEISSAGVLTFVSPPDYENPTDRGLNLNPGVGDTGADTEFEDAGEFAPGDNDYQITVSATERWDGNDQSLPAKRTDRTFTVTVENVDDPGTLTLQWLQPEVGTAITATLADPDADVPTDITVDADGWTWYRSKAADPVVGNLSHWLEITDADADDASYTPVAAYEGKYLWVNVAYTDPQGDEKTADAKSENPVRALVSSPGENGSPDFNAETDTRTVPESTAVDAAVGSPVIAADPDNDTLTYELIEVASPNEGDDEFFDIDRATGQITVAQELDYDAVGERTATATAGEYKVIVRATDPSGLADNITVTITAENVNEAPIVTGQAELSVAELTGAVYVSLLDAPATQPTTPGSRTYTRNEYVFEEPDHLDSIADWQLEGDDAGAFDLSGRFEPRYIQFKETPDFENPTDMNRDNVYEVTLVATDTDPLKTGAGIGKVNVWLIVTPVDEKGKVVFTEGETAYLDQELVAEVQDPDDHGGDLGEPYEGVHIVSWQWSRSLDDDDATNAPFVNIAGATTNRYTPPDDDRGYYLRVTATYTDPHSDPDNPDTEMIDERISTTLPNTDNPSLRTEMATTEFAVRVDPALESAPTFDETGAVTRLVAENTGSGGNVGAPVTASGPEGITYSLEGSDSKYFNIDMSSGQITVGGDVESTTDVEEMGEDPGLDFEDPDKDNFSVTVKAANGGQSAEVTVNIVVTDVNEPPVVKDSADPPNVLPRTEGDPPVEVAEGESYAENGLDPVAIYMAEDPEGQPIIWDLRGVDASSFTIDGGELRFVNPPDYEDPKDRVRVATDMNGDDDTDDFGEAASTAGDRIYDVIVRAIAARASGDTGPAQAVSFIVNVEVTNEDEDGAIVLSRLQPEVDAPVTSDNDDAINTQITATLTDPDGTVIVQNWAWTVSTVVQGALAIDNPDHWETALGGGAATESYTPAESDKGRFLRVTATYTDAAVADVDDDGDTVRFRTMYAVQEAEGGFANGSPDFLADSVERSVAESVAVGANVGAPVRVTTGGGSAKDRLTYELDNDTTAVGEIPATGNDVQFFNINQATGQITVAKRLDADEVEDGRAVDATAGEYEVIVRVTDPSGLSDTVVVAITAEDRNDNPVLRGRPELTIDEIDSGAANAESPDFVGNPDPVGQDPAVPTVNVYDVDDEDDRASVASWRLAGEDAGQFQLIGTVGRTLVFTTQPDYENPADADGDNVYKVTVVAIDNDGGRGEFDVCIAVNNINEAGKITLLDEDGVELVQPRSLEPITAELTDPDGGISGVSWVWTKSPTSPPPGDFSEIDLDDATSDTYTPRSDDTSDYLRVTATYMDELEGAQTAVATTAFAVLELEDEKRPPVFPEETAMRMVAENAPSTTFVGDPVPLAMDPDDPQGVGLTYTLEGEDTAFFELFMVDATPEDENDDVERATTQIVVSLHDEAHDLDHEDRNGMYEVVLKVTDGDLEDTITVTITVMDRNEAPSTPAEASDDAPTTPTNNAPEFAAATDTRRVAQGTAAGTNIGAPVEATDADAGDTLTYRLGGTDAASFDIDANNGQLMTKAALDAAVKDTYTVEVEASDGTDTDSVTVTITVTEGAGYDANGNGLIDGPEVIQAVRDYFAGTITGPEVIAVVRQYFDDRS